MFESLKDNLPELAVALGKLRTHRSSRALLIPPAGPGSVGDAAMISASVQILRDMNYKVDLLQVEHGAVWDLDASPDQMIPAGDFMTFGSRTQLASLIYGMAGYSDVIMIGADILDGVYDDTLANRRLVFDRLRSRDSVTKLFNVLGPRSASRPGGYTRILKMGFRVGDNAPMAYVELVDRAEEAGDAAAE